MPTNPPALQHVPEHGVFGEEHGIKFGSGPGSPYMWVLDPIDGTKSFITGGFPKRWQSEFSNQPKRKG